MPIINFYELEEVKKIIGDDEKDDQYEHSGVARDSRTLFCGSTGSGKSNAVMNLISLMSNGKKGLWKHIFVCYKTDEPLYQWLGEKTKGKISFFRSINDFPKVQDFQDLQGQKAKNKERFLCIFDDCINDKSSAERKKMDDYWAFGRKKGITCFFLSQSYFMTPKFIRDNCNYLILNSIRSSKDLDRILREYEFGEISKDDMQNMYKQCKAVDELSFLKIDLNAKCHPNRKFSCGFDSFFTLQD